jgi:hypothetical protein
MLAADSVGIFEGPCCCLFSLTVPAIRQAWSAPSDSLPHLALRHPRVSFQGYTLHRTAHTIWHRACGIT